ncbi:unnamed protein product, partial [marine sediment metagenome]
MPNMVVECGCGCGGNFLKYDKYGRERKFLSGHNLVSNFNRTIEDVFWLNVIKSEGCWEWQGDDRKGYGYFKYKHKKYSAHRISWQI